jgi:hypothetical protein
MQHECSVMSRSVRDPESIRERQARAQEADRIGHAQERDLSFAAHCEGYGLEWIDELEKA